MARFLRRKLHFRRSPDWKVSNEEVESCDTLRFTWCKQKLTDLPQQSSMNNNLLFYLFSPRFYEESGEATEYFWQIDRKVQFGESSRNFLIKQLKP